MLRAIAIAVVLFAGITSGLSLKASMASAQASAHQTTVIKVRADRTAVRPSPKHHLKLASAKLPAGAFAYGFD